MSSQPNSDRRSFVGAAAFGLTSLLAAPLLYRSARSAGINGIDEGAMPELKGATGWINTAPLTTASLRGKVVLVDVWTYSCINSLRQLPYLKYWAEKYKSAGLVVIGVHSPEFAFEKERANVEQAVRDYKITYPVAIDSNRGVWNAFSNNYWPADYFIDAKGRIRHHHFGEGEYDKSERIIMDLLKENGTTSFNVDVRFAMGTGIEAPPSEGDSFSPETYVGFFRADNFASPEKRVPGVATHYTAPRNPSMNEWGVSGLWNIGGESAQLETAPGSIEFRFHSRDLHMVLTPSKNGKPVRFRVSIDGNAPGASAGTDVAADGSGVVRQPQLFQLLRQQGSVRERNFQIEFLDPGVQAFAFTFG